MTTSIPNLLLLAPTNKDEYLNMLDWAMSQKEAPVVIRVPSGLPETGKSSAFEPYKSEVVEKGNDVAILALGNFMKLGFEVAAALKEKGINPTLINPKFYHTPDEALLEGLKGSHKLVVTLEDGVLSGGFGEKVARFFGTSNVKVLTYGGKKEFTDREALESIYQRNRLTAPLIVEDAMAVL